MDDIIYIVGLFISSLVSVSIIFDFMNKLFERNYKDKKLYYVLARIVFIIILAAINAVHISFLNLFAALLISWYLGFKLYSGNIKRIVFYNVCLFLCVGACESFGMAFIHFLFKLLDIEIISIKMNIFLDLTANQIFVIFIYRLFLLQVLKKKEIKELTHKQYFISIIYTLFSLLNIYSMYILLSASSAPRDIILAMINSVGIVIINTYFINILEVTSEINQLQYENNLFLQQTKMQYQYYDQLEQQYRESLSILHDVKKHIWSIEELIRNQEIEKANEYTTNLNGIIGSFEMNYFSDNRMLNIILNDKKRLAEQNNIEFNCTLDNADLNFIDNIDLTTIFANLLDNSIEACMELEGEKCIFVQVGAFNNLVVINIKNTMTNEPIYVGLNMKSTKKNHGGLGIGNVMKVVNKYNGDFNIQREGNLFACNIVLSKLGRFM